MARTKRTARKSVSGAPILSKNEARRLAKTRAEARCRGGKELRTDASNQMFFKMMNHVANDRGKAENRSFIEVKAESRPWR